MSQQNQSALRRAPEQNRGRQSVAGILKAAENLIAATGADALSMTNLAKQAGMSKPALYRYFPNKQAIFKELARSMFEENHKVILQSIAVTGSDIKAGVYQAIRNYCALQQQYPYRNHLRAAISADPQLATMDLKDSRNNAASAAELFAQRYPAIDRSALEKRLFLLMGNIDSLSHVCSMVEPDEAESLICECAEMTLLSLGLSPNMVTTS